MVKTIDFKKSDKAAVEGFLTVDFPDIRIEWAESGGSVSMTAAPAVYYGVMGFLTGLGKGRKETSPKEEALVRVRFADLIKDYQYGKPEDRCKALRCIRLGLETTKRKHGDVTESNSMYWVRYFERAAGMFYEFELGDESKM